MCNCVILDVTVKKILITAFLKKLPFLAKGLIILVIFDIPFNLLLGTNNYPQGIYSGVNKSFLCMIHIIAFSVATCLLHIKNIISSM